MHFGTTSQGEDLEVFSLLSSQLEVRITNYGARVLSVIYRGTDMLYGPKTAEELMADTCYCGAVCGRVANRIAGGVFEQGGKEYRLACNNGSNHLHGGMCGFSDKVWAVDSVSDTRVEMSLISPDGEEGYPGTVSVKAVYELTGDTLCMRLSAQTDAPTLLNLTNHAYWNLNGTGTMDNHLLQVCATAYTPMVANIL